MLKPAGPDISGASIRALFMAISLGGIGCTAAQQAALPPLTLWAWERPERLQFIDPTQTAVAFLAGTLTLRGSEVEARPRLQPLEIPPETRLTAVVRIEAAKGEVIDDGPLERTVAAILRLSGRPGVGAVQLDFDAARSQRPFYRELLEALRDRLPPEQGLSMTALASWCLHDRWLEGLPVEFAVPMMFRMGAGAAEARQVLAREGEFPEPLCRLAVGVMEDEPWPPLTRPRPVYAFRARPWDAAAVSHLHEEIGRWSK